MPLVKVSELEGPALDWAVAKCEGRSYTFSIRTGGDYNGNTTYGHTRNYSTDWSQGGPIIEREMGNLYRRVNATPLEPEVWTGIAYKRTPDYTVAVHQDGPTPLIAAMRCYCSSKLGDVVDIPEELCQQQKS